MGLKNTFQDRGSYVETSYHPDSKVPEPLNVGCRGVAFICDESRKPHSSAADCNQ